MECVGTKGQNNTVFNYQHNHWNTFGCKYLKKAIEENFLYTKMSPMSKKCYLKFFTKAKKYFIQEVYINDDVNGTYNACQSTRSFLSCLELPVLNYVVQ